MKIIVRNNVGEIILDDQMTDVPLGRYESYNKLLIELISHTCNKLKEITNEKVTYEVN